MPIAVKDYTWEETERMIYITVPLKGVKPNKVDIFSTEEYLKVSICHQSVHLSLGVLGYLPSHIDFSAVH